MRIKPFIILISTFLFLSSVYGQELSDQVKGDWVIKKFQCAGQFGMTNQMAEFYINDTITINKYIKRTLAGIKANAEVNVQRDWNATSGDAFVLNRMNTAGVNAPVGAVNGNVLCYDGTNWVNKVMTINPAGGSQPFSNMQPYLVVNYCVSAFGVFPQQNSQPYVGEIRMFGFNFNPVGWYFCDGQYLSISENEVLFTLIGTTYGGDGESTFCVPDLRGRLPMHQGTGSGLSTRIIGQTFGQEETTILSNQLPPHTHTLIFQ